MGGATLTRRTDATSTTPSPACGHSGSDGRVKPRRELRYRRSLIYNCPFSGGQAPPPAIPASTSPSKPVRPHVVGAKSAQLRFRLAAKTAPAPLLLLSKPDPLRAGLRFGRRLRRRIRKNFCKVRSAPFPPDGENCARSLAPPLQIEPACAGLRFGTAASPPFCQGARCFLSI